MAIQVKSEANEIGIVEAPQGNVVSADFDLQELLYSTADYLLPLVISLAVLLLIVAGFKWIGALGDEFKINRAKKIIKTTIIALILAILAGLIVRLLIQFFYN